MLTKRDIQHGLIRLGLQAGDQIIVHSSLKSFGQVDGGADAVIDALLEVIGPDGTLMAPTNTFNGSVTVFLRQTQQIDLRTAPSLMGKITETLRKRPGAIRSIHPTHPVAGIGSRVAELLGDHHRGDSTCGLSPYGKLAKIARGKVILLGVSTASMTLLHTVEEYFTSYIFIGEEFTVATTAADAMIHQVKVNGYCTNTPRNFPVFDSALEKAGTLKRSAIGQSMATMIDAGSVLKLGEIKLRENPRMLLA